jgi:integrase
VLLCGARRGEACGFRWTGSDLDAGYLAVERTILLIGAAVVEGTPKTGDSQRLLWLDAETARLLREHRRAQLAARLRAGSAWTDSDLVFCRADGTPYRPDYVLRRFQRLAKDAGLPVIKLHEGRHTAVSLMRDAGVDQAVRMRAVGHVTESVHDRYTHVLADSHRAAAEQVAALVAKAAKP